MDSVSRRPLALLLTAAAVLVVALGAACGGSDGDGGSPTTAPDAGPDTATDPPVEPADGDVVRTACGAAGVKPGFVARSTVSFGGSKGTYSLYLPDRYDGATVFPVIFAFHGDGGDGQSMRGAQLEEAAAGGAIIVYPDGPNQTWDLETPPAQNRDYAFFDAMVEDVKTKLCSDPKRIFAFGFSRGAFFANQLGCFRGDLVRGISAHSGGGPYSNDGNDFDQNGFFKCPKPAVAALIIHGESDDSNGVPYAAGVKSRDHWRLRNACGTTTKAYPPRPCVAYDGCPAGHAVAWCSIPGMGHQLWSNTGQAVWSFFSAL